MAFLPKIARIQIPPLGVRFSLRSLAVVVTLLCVWLGIVANRAQRQRAIVESLRAKGVAVYYDYQVQNGEIINDSELPPSDWMRELLGGDFFSTVVGVDFRGSDHDPDDDDLIEVGQLPGLRFAQIARIDRQCSPVFLPNTTRVGPFGYLPGTPRTSQITRLGLTHLEPLLRSVEVMVLGGESITDECVPSFKQFVRLRRLAVANSMLSEKAVDELKRTLRNCDVIVWNDFLDNEVIEFQHVENDEFPGRYWNTTTLPEPLR